MFLVKVCCLSFPGTRDSGKIMTNKTACALNVLLQHFFIRDQVADDSRVSFRYDWFCESNVHPAQPQEFIVPLFGNELFPEQSVDARWGTEVKIESYAIVRLQGQWCSVKAFVKNSSRTHYCVVVKDVCLSFPSRQRVWQNPKHFFSISSLLLIRKRWATSSLLSKSD